MPPEQLPWDRRDFRKHERSGSDPRYGGGGLAGGGPNRWREQHHHPHQPPPHAPPYHHQQRWYSEFRSSRPIPSGNGKQGGWHMYPDEAGHGFLPFGSRYGDRTIDDDNFRPCGSRGDGRYFRNSRENRGPTNPKDWRSPSWEPAVSPNGPGRPTSEVSNQKCIEKAETSNNGNVKNEDSSHHVPNSLSDLSQSHLKEKHVKNVGTSDGPTSSGQKSDKENGLGSIDWKSLKWTRSGSLSTRGPGFSHSNSSKNMAVDSTEIVTELQHKNATPVQSPAACVVSPSLASSDETSSRKKPRLGWGEGLAKYEKKKVEDPEDGATKDGVVSVGNTETMQSPTANLLVKSPKVASLSVCTSPATPSSGTCNSSPGVEEKEPFKAAKYDQETANLSCSPNIMSQTHEEPSFNLEKLDLTSIANLSSFINELLQPVDPSSLETGYVRTTSMNKLLVWKVDMLKALEGTESEIDSLETELKSLIAESRRSCSHPAACSSPLAGCHLKPCEEQVTASSFTVGDAPLQFVSCVEVVVDDRPAAREDLHAALKDDEADSPGSATSKLVETLPSAEIAFPSETAKHIEGSDNLTLDSLCNLGGPSDKDNVVHVDDYKTDASNCQTAAMVCNMNCDTDHIYDSVLASNKDIAETALEELNKLLPIQQSLFDVLTAYPLKQDSSVIKKKFQMRKQFLQFKEKALALKFRTFQHFWKEGRVVSIRKLRGKSHKKFDPSRTDYKNNRSSNRSRISYVAGSLQTVPAEEVIEFVNWLLSESALRPCRNTLKMPSLILDEEIKMSRFISNNGLVEDPCAAEKERSMINPWTAVERETFIDKLAAFGKNFSKIASFLEHKTIADCIEFYYKNHKSECFERARKKPEFANQSKSQPTTYLVGTGKRWNREVNAASLHMLGEASVIAANVNDGIETQLKSTSRIYFGASSSHKARVAGDGPLDRSNSLDLYSNETVAADVLAGICGSLSSEAMSSCITSSVDPTDGRQDWRSQRVNTCIKRPLTPDVTQNVDDECSDESCGEMDSSDWTDEEKSIFTQAVSSYGKDFGMISQCVRTRSRDQCKIFFSKAKKCLGLDLIQPGAANAASADDVNGGGSDIEDACIVEAGSGTCNGSSKQGMEEDLPSADIKSIHESDTICGETSGSCPLDSMAAESVLKNSSMDDDKTVGDSHAVSDKQNGVCGLVASSNTKSLGDEEGNDPGLPGPSEDDKDLAGFSDGHHLIENGGQGIVLTEDGKKFELKNADSSEKTAMSCAASGMKSNEPQLSGNVSHPTVDSQCSTQVESVCPKEVDLESHSVGKSTVLPLQQNSCFSSVESSTLFSVPIKYQRNSSSNALTNGDANGINDEHSEKIVRLWNRKQNHSSYSLSNPVPVESSQILKGYPVPVQTVKGLNGNVTCKKDVRFQDPSQREGLLHSDRHTDFSIHKCSGSRHKNDQSMDPSVPPSGCSSDVDKPSGNGDVKLFGKILVSSKQKPNSCLQASPDHNHHHHKVGEQKAMLDSSHSKLDCSNYLVSENVSVRNLGFWDGNRTTTGFTPLSDPTLLLNKYPAAFSSHPNPVLNLEQLPLHGVRNNEIPLNGVAVFPSCSNAVAADYQVLRNQETQQPFTIDMKQQHHDALFSEMQRRNGFGINVVGRGQCSGISDPVAAIKLQYPKGPNISLLQAGNVIREDDTWRSNEDVGR